MGLLVVLMFFLGTFNALAMGMTTAQAIESGVIVAAVTPVVVWLGTKVFTWLWPKIPTSMVFLAVTVLSWAYTQVSGVFEAGDTSYILQIITGVGSVFLNELLKLAGAQKSLTKAAAARGVERKKSVA